MQNLPQNHLDNLAELKCLIKNDAFDAVKENNSDVPDVLSHDAKLVENITQGVARDLLLYAMASLQDMDIVGHVHDEVIVECDRDVSVEEVCRCMEKTPDWADGLLLRANALFSHRLIPKS